MERFKMVEELLRKYKFNKARVDFLENQVKRLTPEDHNDYIEYRMYEPGNSGSVPKFIMESGEEIAQLNKVEETAQEYRTKCKAEYKNAVQETLKELSELKYNITLIEDALETLERLNTKYSTIIERYYIDNVRMEDIADTVHVSRSRCYELCKEGIRWMVRVIFGESAYA